MPDALAVFVYLVIGVVLFWPVWRAGAATHMQVGGDQWRNVWFAQWTLNSLAHGHNPLFSNAANYPGGVNVLINAGAPLLGVLFSPVTVIWGPIATFNVASTLALPLSAMTAYLLIRRIVSWKPAAFFGGLLYGFCPQEVVHGVGGHVNIAFAPFVPLIVLFIYEAVVRQRWRFWVVGILLGLAVTAQFFVSTEILFETVLVSAIALIIGALFWRRQIAAVAPYALRALGVGVITAAVLLVWPAWFLAKGPGHISGPVQLVAQAYRANLLSPVVPDSLQLIKVSSQLATADHFASSVIENGSYLGIPLIALLLAGIVWKRRDKLILLAGLTGIAAFILSMGGAMTIRSSPSLNAAGHAVGRIPLPEALLAKLPLLENLEPARIALQVALFAAITGALLLERLNRRLEGRSRSFVVPVGVPVAVAVIALVPLLPIGLLPGVDRNNTPRGFDRVASGLPNGSVAAVFPFPSGTFPNPTMWQADTEIRFKMPGGSFFVPQGPAHKVAYGGLLGYTFDSQTGEAFTQLAAGHIPDETQATRSTLATEWTSWHLQSVLADPTGCPYPDQAMQFLIWLLGRPSAHYGAIYGWYHVDLS
ncbi:MAG TPA: hypothetical protein VFZ97_03145, partial [Acidimicrobiales bacterium]